MKRQDPNNRYFVTFRSRNPEWPWVEVTVCCTNRKEAKRKAQDLVRPIPGLTLEGVD